MKITKEQLLKIDRKINRDMELASGRINYNRVFKSKKQYTRKQKHKTVWE